MNLYANYVSAILETIAVARQISIDSLTPPARVEIPEGAPKVILFSPHPDDECIIGGLALRLLREARWRIINVAVTQGSNVARQSARWKELQDACNYLQFDLVSTGSRGLERINTETCRSEPDYWNSCVDAITRILGEQQPRVIFFPHESDWNKTHMGTHLLVTEALMQLPQDFECFCVETEYWAAMSNPNIMVEISKDDLADMTAALSFHVGEVQRNPYQLTLPAWMMNNVRRGAELVGGQGVKAPDMNFATLYRLQYWSGGIMRRFYTGGKILTAGTDISRLFSIR